MPLTRSGKCFYLVENLLHPIGTSTTTQIPDLDPGSDASSFGITELVRHTSFRGQGSGIVVKCRLPGEGGRQGGRGEGGLSGYLIPREEENG